jgi:hypothetical protein
MARSTLARHRTLGATYRFAREGNDGGGGGGGTDGGGANGGADSDTDGGGSDGGGSDGGGNDRGYPANTPLAEMTVEQREAYHRYHSRKWQGIADSRKDYDAVKADAEKWREHQRAQQTPSEQAVEEARNEGERQATARAQSERVADLLTVALEARGKTGDELAELVAAANPAAFITDGNVDRAKVTSYAARLAAPVKGGPRPDPSQGPRGESNASSVSAGRDLFAERRKPRQAAGTTA